MADIRLAKPAAGASESVQCAPEARFVFDFPTTDSTLARDGDNLNIRFEDGSNLELQGFYQQYNEENLPSFNIDGTEVAAADFFAAMNEPDLMPAAGPGTGTVANGARFHEWGDSALTGGILHLDGLDWNFSRSFEWDDVPNAVGRNGDDEGWWGAANTVPDLDVPAAPQRPYDPRNPGDDPNNPASPQNPGGYIPNTHGASIVVDEGALAKGSGQHVLHGVHDYGSFVADVHAERGGSIQLSFGGKVVTLAIPEDGSLRIAPSGDASFADVNGVDIRILGATSNGDGKWTVRYEYRLTDHMDHDKQLGQDLVRYDGNGIAITVTDGSGDVTHGKLTVEVHDDVPLLSVLSAPAVIKDSEAEVTARIDSLSFGADNGDAKTLTITVKNDDPMTLEERGEVTGQGTTYTYAMEALPGGGYTFTANEEGAPTLELGDDGAYTLTYSRPVDHVEADDKADATANTYIFTVTVTDSDGDAVSRDVTVTTKPAPFIIPGGEPEPGPEPGPDEPARPASVVVTDDSYLEHGTGTTPKDGDHKADDATAEGDFTLQLNGLPYTLTITGKDALGEDGSEKTLTIKLDADGNVLEPADLDSVELYGDYGKISGIAIREGKVTYTYTQEKQFDHTDKTATDEIADADAFAITLNDGLHDEVKSSIQVKIEDDAPEVSELKAGGEVKDSAATVTAVLESLSFGADDGDAKTLTITVKNDDPMTLEERGEVTGEGTTYTYAIEALPGGGYKFTPNEEGAPTLELEDGAYTLTYTRPVDHVEADDKADATPNTYIFTVTVTDADGDEVSRDVTVTTRPAPFIIPGGPEPGPEPVEPGEPASVVVTDDSYVAHGTKYGETESDGGEAGAATAEGNFSLQLNGLPYTLNISGKDALGEDGSTKTLTIELKPNGSFKSFSVNDGAPNGDLAALAKEELYGDYGKISGIAISEGKVTYTYTQEKQYSHTHENPEDAANTPDEIADADTFAITLKDGLHDEVKSSIQVKIEDDAPEVSELKAGGEVKDSAATVTAVLESLSFGADDGDAKTLTITVKNDDPMTLEERGEVTGEGTTYTYAIEALPGGGYEFTSNEEGAPTLELGDDGAYTLTYTRPVDHVEADDKADATANTYIFTVTVTDADGDAVSRDVTVTTRPAPFIIPGGEPEPGPEPGPDEPARPASVVFTDDSYLAHGTKYGETESDGGEAGAATAQGGFSLQLNGLPYTLTISGKDEAGADKTLTIELDADGNVPEPAVLASEILYGDYGKISGIAISEGKVTYTYTQEKQYSHTHENPEDAANTPDEIADADTFAITLKDGLHDPVSSSIQVKIEDDAPELSLSAKDLGIAVAGQEALQGGTLTFDFGADNGADKSLTVTVDGKESSTNLTDADGKLVEQTIKGKYGSLTITSGEDGKYIYTYKANVDAEDGAQDKFLFTITDADGDVVSSDATGANELVITVEKAPVIDPVLVYEHGLIQDSAETPRTVAVEMPDGWRADTSQTFTGKHGSISYNEESGRWEYTLNADGNVDHLGHDGDGRDIMVRGDTVTVTLEDDHDHTYKADVRVDIMDDVDTLTPTVNAGKISGFTSQTHLNFVYTNPENPSATLTTSADFTGVGWKDLPASGPYMGSLNNVKMYSSSVSYSYDENRETWSVEQMVDCHGQSAGNAGTTANIGGRQNFVLDKDGLGITFTADHYASGVGPYNDGFDANGNNSNWGGAEFGTSDRAGAEKSSYAAEAIVLENTNKTASYGMEIDFGNFGENDKALIAFYMTPQHSDDDNVVMLKLVTWDDFKDDDGNVVITKLLIEVPDGFTKATIAPLPGGPKMTTQSSFTIKSIDMMHPAYEQTGQVTVENGADSMDNANHQADLAWDWSAVKAAMEHGITLQGTMYDGEYGIKWEADPGAKSFTVFLTGGPKGTNYANNALFTASLGADGQWKITQYYDFVLKNDSEPVFDVKFSIMDGDDDVTTLLQQINMSQPDLQERFQHVIDGYWNEVATGEDEAWDAIAHYNDVVDVLAGTSENDLINGLGGNDILIGDGEKQAIQDLEAVVLGPNTSYAGTVMDYDNTIHDVPRNNVGTNYNFWEALNDNLTTLSGEKLDEIAFALEDREVAGGDDALLGGLGNDMLFGGAGNDYLVGNGLDVTNNDEDRKKDHDIIFGGSGADIILYDDASSSDNRAEDNHGDLIVHGGSGIDVLLVGSNTGESLAHLMNSDNDSGTKVRSIEVMIKTNHTSHAENMGVTSLATLASVCGVFIDPEANTMTLSSDWNDNSDGTYSFNKNGLDLTLETNGLRPVTSGGGEGIKFVNTEMDGEVMDFLGYQANRTGTRGNDVLIGSTTAAAFGVAATYDDILQHQDEIAEQLMGVKPEAESYSSLTGGRGDDIVFNTNLTSVLIGDGDASTKGELRVLLQSNVEKPTVEKDIAQLDKLTSNNEIGQVAADLENAESRLETIHDGDDTISSLKGVSLMHGGGGDDKLVNEGGEAILIGGSGNDTLIGGEGKEYLFGGSGDDFINGNGGGDVIFAGSGDDLIVYDPTDYLVDGGTGIDFLLSADRKPDYSLADMLGNWEHNGANKNMPMVHEVEVMLKGVDTSLQNMDALAKKYGFSMEKDANGRDILVLDRGKWELDESQSGNGTNTYVNRDHEDVTLETNLTDVSTTGTDPGEQAAQTIVLVNNG